MSMLLRQKIEIGLCFFLLCSFSLTAMDDIHSDPYAYGELVETITAAGEPKISGKYIIFTADGNARHVGIALENENFKHIYSFQRLSHGSDSKNSVLFHIMAIPEGMRELRYRMVLNGLWSTDPLNPYEVFDYTTGMSLSVLKVPYQKEYKTAVENSGSTKFVYLGDTGKKIYLAGTFNRWDPFMYSLEEVAPGRYELYLPLPKGKWLYAYFVDGQQLPDKTNGNHVYTEDGRVASVITVE